ncbi:EAL domain-containing protein [Devosia sp. YIM 151766]|uniref:EAL domain-containing protein n=1 Tax=Devosia sp. YIM 151766 TaxID=3017325 RepID=UPI00255CD155|nr:EAL domain-containing protein [Devosia sp. YIM 151766]WIY53418.1 EAL domain-containing protein [Devosia sp. YIM 151766]
MQALVYSFIALAAAGIGALAYFALTFTPANAILAALVFGCAGVVAMERTLRIRAENRLERAIGDLSRLLATDAQAGAVLGQRINAIADTNPGPRLEAVEADISVLGTVIRQVAEAVADMEVKVARSGVRYDPSSGSAGPIMAAPGPARPAPRAKEPVIPLETLRQAVADNRLVFHIQPILRLPHRRAIAYDLVPRLLLEDGELADAPDFMPRRGGYEVLRHIEGTALVEAVAIARRARTSGAPLVLHVPLSRATLGDGVAAEQMLVVLDANRAILEGLTFLIEEAEWQALTGQDRAVIDQMARKGAGFSLAGMTSLRIDMAELAALGLRSLRVDAAELIEAPAAFTDFHLSDIADYLARFDVTLLATGIADERQIVELLDNGILLVQGDYIAAPGPVRQDLSLDANRTITPQLRRV